MRERPILFSGPMVRAILDGRKTQTRRVISPQPPTAEAFFGSDFGLSRAVADGVKMYSQNDYERLPKHPTDWELVGSVGVARNAGFPMRYRCPFGQPGDRLWARETWCLADPDYSRYPGDGRPTSAKYGDRWCWYRATEPDAEGDADGSSPWHPSIHMPRWASRLTLEITGVRAERVQDIIEADARAEGFSSREEFRALWSATYGAESWGANPWVWVVGFKPADARREESK